MILLALAITVAISSETLIIISNFAVVLATLMLWSASIHEQHRTIKTIVKSDNALMRFFVKRFGKGTSDPD